MDIIMAIWGFIGGVIGAFLMGGMALAVLAILSNTFFGTKFGE